MSHSPLRRICECAVCSSMFLFVIAVNARAQERGGEPQVLAAIDETDREPAGLIAEPIIVRRLVIKGDRHLGSGDLTNGIYVDTRSMIPGAWISAGPGYRRWYSEDSVLVDMSAAISLKRYETAQARFELPRLLSSRLLAGSQFRWQNFTQVNFYGIGPDTTTSDRTDYRLLSQDVAG